VLVEVIKAAYEMGETYSMLWRVCMQTVLVVKFKGIDFV
jgi:hypothetical protein